MTKSSDIFRGKAREYLNNLLKSAERPGLWANIRAKRARGEKPAKPGDSDYPDRKQWKKLTKASGIAKDPSILRRIYNATGILPEHMVFAGVGSAGLGTALYQLNKDKNEKKAASSPAWQRSEGKNPEGGLNAKGRASYNRETGGKLKAPVTEKNPKGERAGRQNSFCARMCGHKRKNTGAATRNDPDSRVNKALRKWRCKCGTANDMEWTRAGGGIPEMGLAFDAIKNQIPKMQEAAYNFGGKAYDFLSNLKKTQGVETTAKPILAGGNIR